MTGIHAYTNKTPLNRSHGQAWARYAISFVGATLAAKIIIIAAKAAPTPNTNLHPRLLTVTQHGGSVPKPLRHKT